jgi:hypothetical protein
VAAVAVSVPLAPSALGAEYNLHALPEIGRCVKVGKGGGEFRGGACTQGKPTARYAWRSGPSAKKLFTSSFGTTRLIAAGDEISCVSATAEGEFTGPKSLTVKNLVLQGCELNIGTKAERLCQISMGANGVITANELVGELGFISRAKPKRPILGIDLKPASGSNLAVFECGGANEVLGKSLGTGTTRELQGSVVGKIEPIDVMGSDLAVQFEAVGAAQSPEALEGGVKDILTTLVGMSKTAEATVLRAVWHLKSQEPLEVLAKCKGTGC